jgi:nitrate reductase beta subunit
MKIRAQIGKVLNLDKCIGCHTCSVTCKQVWTTRQGIEYAWWNNVESKPGIGYPKDWENQERWRGGWVLGTGGALRPKTGGKWRILSKIFANPELPEIDDYYEPFDYEYSYIHGVPESEAAPTAQPVSIVTGQRMDKVRWGPNWEESLGTEFRKRSKDYNFKDVETAIYGEFENSFLMFLPRLCEHCLNPSCLAACPSGAIYKREEDGIVLIDQEKCRGWRMCVTGCPYKKVYYNWHTGKSEKCIFCYPRIESGQPTVCSETCVGRIRYLGVMLYDADRILEAASKPDVQDCYQAQLDIFLDPNDPAVIAQARRDGIPDSWIEAAQRSPVYKMACDWKVAFPLHPEYRTLPMVWYIPPLSPIQEAADAGALATLEGIPDVDSLRIPVRYLANLLTAGQEPPIRLTLRKLLALRAYMRRRSVENVRDTTALDAVGLTERQAEEMYRIMAIANYEDRFVIPTSHKEVAENAYDQRGIAGFHFSQMTSEGNSRFMLWGQDTRKTRGERFPLDAK